MKKYSKTIGYILVGGALLYLLYYLWQRVKYNKCFPLEEVHPTNAAGNETWVSFVREDDQGTLLRPVSSEFIKGKQFTISNTENSLDGKYTIKEVWIDADGRIGSLKVNTPANYVFKFDAQMGGGTPVDSTYFGVGKICKA